MGDVVAAQAAREKGVEGDDFVGEGVRGGEKVDDGERRFELGPRRQGGGRGGCGLLWFGGFGGFGSRHGGEVLWEWAAVEADQVSNVGRIDAWIRYCDSHRGTVVDIACTLKSFVVFCLVSAVM